MTQNTVVTLISRKVNFDFSETEPTWLSDPIKTQFMHALSLFVPTSERNVIEILRSQMPLLKDKTSQEIITAFIKQEGQHAVMHKRSNTAVQVHHPELKFIEFGYQRFMKLVRRVSSKAFTLAIPVAFEHITSAISKDILHNQTYWIGDKDNEAVQFMLWHSLEELEHQGVCYEIYKKRFNSDWRIILSLIFIWLPSTLGAVLTVQLYLLVKKGMLFNPKSWLTYAGFIARTVKLICQGSFKYRIKNRMIWNQQDTSIYTKALAQFNQKQL